MANFTYDSHFIQFRDSLEEMLTGYTSTRNTSRDEFTKHQKKLVEQLVKEEKNFRMALKKNPYGASVYKSFIKFILEDKKNILAARPYFRERQRNFSKSISPAIRNQNVKKMGNFSINYPFIDFVLKSREWPPNGKINKIANKVKKLREELILHNMPLAISRATMFRERTPDSYLSFMDINQISFEGLINAVDKFVLPYTTVYRSVIIGRISGDLIENYSETMLHFYPSDKRKIYRANKVHRNREEEADYNIIADVVNSGPELASETNASEIQHLMAAASPVSIHTPVQTHQSSDGMRDVTTLDFMAGPEEMQPDEVFERNERNRSLQEAYNGLSPLEVKILKLKGFGL